MLVFSVICLFLDFGKIIFVKAEFQTLIVYFFLSKAFHDFFGKYFSFLFRASRSLAALLLLSSSSVPTPSGKKEGEEGGGGGGEVFDFVCCSQKMIFFPTIRRRRAFWLFRRRRWPWNRNNSLGILLHLGWDLSVWSNEGGGAQGVVWGGEFFYS